MPRDAFRKATKASKENPAKAISPHDLAREFMHNPEAFTQPESIPWEDD